MTPQEKELLERFLADMSAARAGQKDPEADAMIRDAAARQPDAVYLLVQRALQLDQALQLTQAQVQKLQSELDQARAGGAPAGSGFLSDPYAWGARPAAPLASGAQTSVSGQPLRAPGAPQPQPPGQPQQPAAVAQQQPPAQARPGGWGGSGMLGTVAGTAAGVVGGAFLFQGIQNLMHHNDPAAAATPTPAPHPLVAEPQAQEPFLLSDPVADNSAGADDSDIVASDDGSGDDGFA
jgi:hypothetical protein